MKFEFAPLDINKTIRSLAELFGEELRQARIEVSLDLAEGLPLLNADERYIRQMLINLIKNAMGAIKDGGTVSLATSLADDFVQILVRDTGTGIPEHLITKIFEPYFTTKIDGTGLGLSLSYKVVKEHGGDIRVQSELGKGTCFTVYLPVPRRAQKMIEYEEYRK